MWPKRWRGDVGGKPTDNALVESFNGRLRQECLNEHWFLSHQGCAEQNRCVAALL
jgi:hypothetical protein